ncbi:MAG: hypothetical protein P1U41_09865 [Vicingaceae bacterium]|nr:hypothetical protein [Vicingaceae bacterium]
MKSLLLSFFILFATFSFAGNNIKSSIEATITQIKSDKNITQKDKDKFVARFNILLQKLNENNTVETQTQITKEYSRLSHNFTKTTGVNLPASTENYTK